MGMDRRTLYWTAALIAAGLFVHLVQAILLPFLAGFAVAYFLNPAVSCLERRGIGRGWGTALVLLSFISAAFAVTVVVVPIVFEQAMRMAERLPEYADRLSSQAGPLLADIQRRLSPEHAGKLSTGLEGLSGNIAAWIGRVLVGAWSGGLAIVQFLGLIVIAPVVAFYLLRDWPDILAALDGLLPGAHAQTIRRLASEIDERLAGFLRGIGSVCLILAAVYGLGLSAVGLHFGFLVGIVAGLLSFVPYLGAISGLVAGTVLALFQFGPSESVFLVWAVFGVGQALEGYVLTPKLVGNRVGLHPVWIMFALMAGGALFGFVGLLIAVPAAAVIGVVGRHVLAQYRAGEAVLRETSR